MRKWNYGLVEHIVQERDDEANIVLAEGNMLRLDDDACPLIRTAIDEDGEPNRPWDPSHLQVIVNEIHDIEQTAAKENIQPVSKKMNSIAKWLSKAAADTPKQSTLEPKRSLPDEHSAAANTTKRILLKMPGERVLATTNSPAKRRTKKLQIKRPPARNQIQYYFQPKPNSSQ